MSLTYDKIPLLDQLTVLSLKSPYKKGFLVYIMHVVNYYGQLYRIKNKTSNV